MTYKENLEKLQLILLGSDEIDPTPYKMAETYTEKIAECESFIKNEYDNLLIARLKYSIAKYKFIMTEKQINSGEGWSSRFAFEDYTTDSDVEFAKKRIDQILKDIAWYKSVIDDYELKAILNGE